MKIYILISFFTDEIVVHPGELSDTLATLLLFVPSSQYPIMAPVAHSLNKFGICTETPDIVTIIPKTTSPSAGNFSLLNNECGSSWMNAKPGRTYANGIAANSP